jgi:excisionase family DNA binding protein
MSGGRTIVVLTLMPIDGRRARTLSRLATTYFDVASTVQDMTENINVPLTIPEAAVRLNVSERTGRRLVHEGKLHHVRVGRRLVRVLPSQVDSYLSENTVTAMP